MRIGAGLVFFVAGCGAALAEPPPTIEKLLGDGWEIAGFASGYDNRTIVNCYELR